MHCQDCKWCCYAYTDALRGCHGWHDICVINRVIAPTEYISDEEAEEFHCKDYKPYESCENCMYSKKIVYETGEVDCIDYACDHPDHKSKKIIYSDISPFQIQNYLFPECPYDDWVREG